MKCILLNSLCTLQWCHKILLFTLAVLIWSIILQNITYIGERTIVSHHGSYRDMYLFLSLLMVLCNLSSRHTIMLAITFSSNCGHFTQNNLECSVKLTQLKAKPCVTINSHCVIAFCLSERRGKKWLVKSKSSLVERECILFSPSSFLSLVCTIAETPIAKLLLPLIVSFKLLLRFSTKETLSCLTIRFKRHRGNNSP